MMEGGEEGVVGKVVVDTQLTPDGVEFCPVAGFQSLLAAGCYQLQSPSPPCTLDQRKEVEEDECVEVVREEGGPTIAASMPFSYSDRRVGCLWLYQLEARRAGGSCLLETIQRLTCRGVLDLKWNFHEVDGGVLLATANSESYISLWKVTQKNRNHNDNNNNYEKQKDTVGMYGVECLQSAQLPAASSESLALSLDWNDRLHTSCNNCRIFVSHSDGQLSIWEADMSGARGGQPLQCIDHWQAHSNEAWIAASNYWNPSLLYSGSDDCTLKSWDLRVSKTPILTKRHDMGVTTIQSHPLREHYLASGSYDEMVSIWDVRAMQRPLTQHHVGGGVWRVKWHPADPSLLAVACMHAGFQICRHLVIPNLSQSLSSSSSSTTSSSSSFSFETQMETVARYDQVHQSLGYGIDWSYQFAQDSKQKDKLAAVMIDRDRDTDTASGDGDRGYHIVASCSFYDHMLSVWSWTAELNKNK
jgi:diphthamide biosynthesis protein 7